MIERLLPILAALATSPDTPHPPAHADEIALYGDLMGVVLTASDLCPGTVVNSTMGERMKVALHLHTEDKPALKALVDTKVEEMKQRAAPPNRQAWCDEVLRAYGANGDTVPQLLSR